MGLGGFKNSWQRQSKDFGHGQNTNRDQSTKYSCLVFDNRGVGESDKPLAWYSTSEMAKDTLELVDHVGWTSNRQLHVIGVSMGGMIAQELVRHPTIPFYFHPVFMKSVLILQACMAPERIASLSLVSTAPKLFNTVVRIPCRAEQNRPLTSLKGFFENLRNRADLLLVDRPSHLPKSAC